MKFSISAVLFTLMAVASAEAGMSHLFARQNEGRPVVNGACCVAGQSKRQDFCSVNGAQGKCVPANTAGCKSSPCTAVDEPNRCGLH